MQTAEIQGRDREQSLARQPRRVVGLFGALLRLGSRATREGARLASHFESYGIAVHNVESIATSVDGAIRVLEMQVAGAAHPIVFLACASAVEAQSVFARMRATEGDDLLFCNGSTIMYLWHWSAEAPQLGNIVAAFAALRHAPGVGILTERARSRALRSL